LDITDQVCNALRVANEQPPSLPPLPAMKFNALAPTTQPTP
jgi:hypothetical protein